MFENASIMAVLSNNEIRKLDMTADVQQIICELFCNATFHIYGDLIEVDFDGNYKPNENECLKIENYQLSDDIKDAIRNPLSIHSFDRNEFDDVEIKFIFIGEKEDAEGKEVFKISFQKLRKENIVSQYKVNLVFDKNMFYHQKCFGFSVTDDINCFYNGKDLLFTSYYFARQIFDLSTYYRSATNSEVKEFTKCNVLEFEDSEDFVNQANTWIRRKIAAINDSGILKQFSAKNLQDIARDTGIELNINNDKIVFPQSKRDIRLVLGFLDEEAYKGPFTKSTFLAGSKRPVKKQST